MYIHCVFYWNHLSKPAFNRMTDLFSKLLHFRRKKKKPEGQGVAGWETHKVLHKSQKGQTKNTGPKNQRWMGSHWSGGGTQNVYQLAKRNKSPTPNPEFHQNGKHSEASDGVDSLKTHNQLNRGNCSLLISSPSWLIAASWGRASQVHPIASAHQWPRSWEIPVHTRTLGESLICP